jgi:hypothetical protein
MAKTIKGETKHSHLAWAVALRVYFWGWVRVSEWIIGHFTYWRFPEGYGKWHRISEEFKVEVTLDDRTQRIDP